MLWKPWPVTSMITELHKGLDSFASCLRAAPGCCKAPLVNGGCAGRSDHLRGSSQQFFRDHVSVTSLRVAAECVPKYVTGVSSHRKNREVRVERCWLSRSLRRVDDFWSGCLMVKRSSLLVSQNRFKGTPAGKPCIWSFKNQADSRRISLKPIHWIFTS